MLEPKNQDKRYIYILSDGILREKVSEGTEGAVLRKWETKDGKSGEKWEKTYERISNVKIVNIGFDQGEYGEQLQLTLEDEENSVILTLPVNSRFAEDIMKKLPNVNVDEEITIAPYCFTGDDNRQKRGVNLYQQSDKVINFFYDAEKKEALNGYPEPTEEDKSDWKFYYTKANKFLVRYIKENLVTKFAGVSERETINRADGEGIDPKDIPF